MAIFPNKTEQEIATMAAKQANNDAGRAAFEALAPEFRLHEGPWDRLGPRERAAWAAVESSIATKTHGRTMEIARWLRSEGLPGFRNDPEDYARVPDTELPSGRGDEDEEQPQGFTNPGAEFCGGRRRIPDTEPAPADPGFGLDAGPYPHPKEEAPLSVRPAANDRVSRVCLDPDKMHGACDGQGGSDY